jgi:hypothetical protein
LPRRHALAELDLELGDATSKRRYDFHETAWIGLDGSRKNQGPPNLLFGHSFDGQLGAQGRAFGHNDAVSLPHEKRSAVGLGRPLGQRLGPIGRDDLPIGTGHQHDGKPDKTEPHRDRGEADS